MNKWLSIGVLSLIAFISCNKESKPTSPVVAKVGNQVFTLDDLKKVIPENPDFEISSIQIQNYIKRWIENELVYQEALVDGYDKREEIKEGVQKVIKEYIVSQYLEQKVDDQATVSDAEVEEFYKENLDEFVREENFYKCQLILVKTYREANEISAKLSSGETFESLAKQYSLDESRVDGGELGWITLNQLPEIIAARIPYMGINNSQQIKSIHGYFIVNVSEIRKKGETQTLEEVKQRVSWRVLAWKRENQYRKLITFLSENANIETNWNIINSSFPDSLK